MHYYKKNIGDYAKKAGRLSMLQHGAYTLLIDSCYDRERFPTKEEAIDWVWASSSDEIEAVEFVLKKFFVLTDGVYVQSRIEEEVNAYKELGLKNKQIAIDREAKRAENRTKRDKDSTKRAQGVHDLPDNPNATPPNQEPRTINQEPLTKEKESAHDPYQKFPMFTDWKPDPVSWPANAFRSGNPILNDDSLNNFVLYWQGERKSFTEAQWQGKLIGSLKRDAPIQAKIKGDTHAANQSVNQRSLAGRSEAEAREAFEFIQNENDDAQAVGDYEQVVSRQMAAGQRRSS